MTDRKLTHLDEQGQARMVDVGDKAVSQRRAAASARVVMQPETLQALLSGATPKGDVLATARIAGITAAKRTAELIPLCHAITLTAVEVEFVSLVAEACLEIRTQVRALDRTGAEMEALTAASVAALTIYDMLKAIDRGMTIERVRLEEKSGGKSGTFERG
jgi:cyclic pyranopterin phosphate synthase